MVLWWSFNMVSPDHQNPNGTLISYSGNACDNYMLGKYLLCREFSTSLLHRHSIWYGRLWRYWRQVPVMNKWIIICVYVKLRLEEVQTHHFLSLDNQSRTSWGWSLRYWRYEDMESGRTSDDSTPQPPRNALILWLCHFLGLLHWCSNTTSSLQGSE